jgi:hypothetical protein
MWLGMLKGLWYIPVSLKPRQDPVGAFGIQSGALSSYTVCMKNFVVESGDFIATSGIYRMNDHPGQEITLIYCDAVPTFQGRKISFDSSGQPKILGEAKKMEQLTMSAPRESRQTAVEQVSRF